VSLDQVANVTPQDICRAMNVPVQLEDPFQPAVSTPMDDATSHLLRIDEHRLNEFFKFGEALIFVSETRFSRAHSCPPSPSSQASC
jgi:hypothetical protein